MPEDVKAMYEVFSPYLVQTANGIKEFKPGTPAEIVQLRKKALERWDAYDKEILFG